MKAVPTLRSLALKAGVHHTTLSRALRNDPRLPETTRQRLIALAKTAGYQTDALRTRCMAALQRGKAAHAPEVIGLLTGKTRFHEGEEPFKAFCRNISQRAEELGYRIEELWADEPGMTPARLNKVIRARGIEGIIIPPSFESPYGKLGLDLTRVACVLHSHAVFEPRLHGVEAHNFPNMLMVIEKLWQLNYRRIGLLLYLGIDKSTSHEWEGAYHYFHAKHPELGTVPVFYSDTFEDERMLGWVKSSRLEVVVGAYPYHAEFFRGRGIRVPEELGCVSMGVHPWDLPMAGLDMRAPEIDRAAVDLVVAQLNRNEKGIPRVPRDVLIEGCWHDGPTVQMRPAPGQRVSTQNQSRGDSDF